ncbi:helix-turn-helix transcriptional regulator [Bifidobacterium pseudolongum]|uniref:helix-turn-helix transcriptional regulator n=1 Tax=Bifidobacterium pseudolongum TaxID=1694 RepID=UPI0010D11D15|nr:helix-turn-helix domain-containing protein [Bifidobacterium pseudolongum]RYQ68734.1 phage transcriptional regulator, AlpA [Bifidobacterium pseudolongum subsp. globosum]
MSSDMLDDADAGEEDILLTPDDVARMMRVNRRTVSTWRYRGKGPRYVHVTHNCVRYRMSEVRKWLSDMEKQESEVA